MDELRAALEAEFARLGIDPSKAVAAAPTGQANAVFDLSAEVVDPDGEGGEPPTGIELSWTDQLTGDYIEWLGGEFDPEDFDATVMSTAKTLGKLDRTAFATTKRRLRQATVDRIMAAA